MSTSVLYWAVNRRTHDHVLALGNPRLVYRVGVRPNGAISAMLGIFNADPGEKRQFNKPMPKQFAYALRIRPKKKGSIGGMDG